ncbi:NAD(P)-dependent oxidoreductase [Cryptosporangium sp. NPDC048952]|uniref:NAD(P)-dependent oxidoreductase n=1 Tax=Cryptosporangium sp. NPDC048952 TaxID=3363961 RepID=UPI003723B556
MNVTVIGLGPMGRAMASSLDRAGHTVTVWNRTPSRADGLAARLVATPAEAVAASELVILSLTDYPAMYSILDGVTDFAGKTLVNLSSDTPDASRDAAARYPRFLTGGVMVPAPVVGTPGASVLYSGSQALFGRYEPVLRVIGAPTWLGEDPGLAQLFYQAYLDVFLTSLSSLLHATALVTASGVPADRFLPSALEFVTQIPVMIGDGAEIARRLEAGEHPGALSTARMMGATADHIVRTAKASGVDPGLAEAVKSQYDRAIDAGHGSDDWTALYEVIRAK